MKIIPLSLAILFIPLAVGAQQITDQEPDSLQAPEITLDEVMVSALRATREIPITFTDLQKKDFQPRNLGQDIPILLNYLPAVVTTSDAGAGVGYTGIRVRGSDATRVNVTINGIPYNDPESHGTFWVNMPDFASSVENLQLQRGVGTSTNGAGAFGASLNLLTDKTSEDAFALVSSSAGSYHTLKNTVKFSTGLMRGHVEMAGRLSRITSDGYIDRASSALDSYFLQGAYLNGHTLIKALLFGGHEVTYQSWYGFDPATLAAIGVDPNLDTNRTYNIAGIQFDDAGNFEGFYGNQVDNYKQDHFQLHWNETWSTSWSSHLALHYTRGRGFYEEYVDDWYYSNILFAEDSQLSFIGREDFTLNGEEVNSTDYIRRRWLDNDFYGTVFSATYAQAPVRIVLGGGYNFYLGDHFGEVLWSQYSNGDPIRDRYYEDDSRKTDLNFFAKSSYDMGTDWSLFGDLQYRRVGYRANGAETGTVDDSFNFFNPKAGVTYHLSPANNIYFSYARAHREPNRNDYESGAPKPEKLNDFELGWRFLSDALQLNANVYYMRYKDQLVLTGELNDVGAPLRANVGDSYRLGLEMDASLDLSTKWRWEPNFALSSNRNVDFFFERDGQLRDLGQTHIAYSPSLIIGNHLTYAPLEALQMSLLTKYVGKQFMGNIDSEASVLKAYSQTDLNIQYRLDVGDWADGLTLSALVNNLFDAHYESNGYFYTYDDDFTNPGAVTTIEGAGYYPQAGIHFLLGGTLRF